MDTFTRGAVHPTALISPIASLGANVTVGAFTVIHDGVEIGDDTVIGSHCVVGEPTSEFYRGEIGTGAPCVVGERSVVRSHSVIYRGAHVGAGFECGHRVTIREGSHVGVGVRVGTMSDLQGDLKIGDYARLHSSVFVPSGSRIGAFAWLFPYVLLANDPHPPSDTCIGGPDIGRFAVIAARSMVMPGVRVGEQALVGAMSLVTHDVEARMVVLGAPAEPVGPVSDVRCQHGRLDHVYPWPDQFRRGYPDGVLPDVGELN